MLGVTVNAKRLVRAVVAALPAPLARRALYLHRFGKLPNMSSPRTFQEKLNYRILNDRRPILVTASSKVLSKEFVQKKHIPGLHVPITYWHGRDLSEIDGEKFDGGWVLKPSHRSGGVIINEGDVFSLEEHNIDSESLLSEREYRISKLWAYKVVPREFILEQRLGDSGSAPIDYKFFVFDGTVKLIQVDSGRFGHHTRNLYTPAWSPLPLVFGVPRGVPTDAPSQLGTMLRVAELLGVEFDFVRVDLFLEGDRVYFGELTVYPGGGLSPWPPDLDLELGAMWSIPHAEIQASRLNRETS